MAKQDYYETLGLHRNASVDEIKAAYRKKALQFHPDRNQGNKDAEEKFKNANEAYSVLSDSEKRKAYDQFGHAGVQGGAAGGGPGFGGFDFGNMGDIFGDIFEEAFGSIGGRKRRRRARSGRDLRVDHEVSILDVLNGKEVTLTVPKYDSCEVCKGSGAKEGSGYRTCADCRGHGQVRISQGFFTMAQTCGRCQGYGQIIEKPCTTCSGSGRVEQRKQVRVRIPPGVEDGTTLRISGGGEAGERGAEPGDLYVVIQVQLDKRFERQGADLFVNVVSSFPLAALGGEMEVPSLDGTVRLKIPAGTQPGVRFRVSERGLPHLKARGRGDLYVNVQVEVPKKLKKEEKKLIQDLANKLGEKRISKDDNVFRKVFGG
ncbi:molecular chaperone DnaJ [bacterium F11]|nr:molecular chaperone DnaJ [bacterium F11]